MEIDAASNNSVDDARLLIERAPLVAQSGSFKLYIIDECHMLTKEAFNALLKTIEEPPPRVIFVLATTEEHKVPPTIISRCQRLMFRLVNQSKLVLHLRSIADRENINIEDSALELIARRSGGGLRDALGLLDQASLLATPEHPVSVNDLLMLLGGVHEDVLLKISAAIRDRDGLSVLQATNSLLLEGREPALVALELAKHFLNLGKARYLHTGDELQPETVQNLILGSPTYLQGLIEQAPTFEPSELSQMVEQLDKLDQVCRRSSQPALNLESGLLSLCHRFDMVIIHDLLSRLAQVEATVFDGAQPLRAARTPANQAKPMGAHTAAGSLQKPLEAKAVNAAQSDTDDYVLESITIEEEEPLAAATLVAVAADQTSSARPMPVDSTSSVLQPPTSQTAPPIGAPATAKTGLQAGETSAPTTTVEVQRSNSPSPVGRPGTDSFGHSAPAAPSAPASSHPIAPTSATTASTRTPTLPAAPAPATPALAAPALAAPASSSVDRLTLDELWQDLLEELQRRHLPTYSLVSTHAFAVSLESDELLVGVMVENFQKMLESKTEHIRGACSAVLGRPVRVRVRVSNHNAPRQGQVPNRARAKREPAGDATTDEAEGAEQTPAIIRQNPPSAPERVATAPPTPRPAATANGALSHRDRVLPAPPETDQTLIQEAHKLFDGPGSRRIPEDC